TLMHVVSYLLRQMPDTRQNRPRRSESVERVRPATGVSTKGRPSVSANGRARGWLPRRTIPGDELHSCTWVQNITEPSVWPGDDRQSSAASAGGEAGAGASAFLGGPDRFHSIGDLAGQGGKTSLHQQHRAAVGARGGDIAIAEAPLEAADGLPGRLEGPVRVVTANDRATAPAGAGLDHRHLGAALEREANPVARQPARDHLLGVQPEQLAIAARQLHFELPHVGGPQRSRT